MNIRDLEELSGEDRRTRLSGPIRDGAGEESHLLLIEGPTELVRAAFANSDFEISIEPGGGRDDWERRFREALHARPQATGTPGEALEGGLFKPTPDLPAATDSVVMILQRTRPGGTNFLLSVPFAVARGMSLLFVLPPVCSAAGISFPSAGDPDLFLMLSPAGPTVDSSTFGGLTADSVSFSLPICLPLVGFVPFFRVFGFLPSTGVLLFGGFAFP